MKTFDYVRPATIADAIVAAAEPGAAYLAAGTNLLDLMKGGITRPSRLVDVTRLPGLDRIEQLPDGGVRIGAMVRNADLGQLYYLDTARLNLGLYQNDCNVLWDLAPHDVSILNFVLGGVAMITAST